MNEILVPRINCNTIISDFDTLNIMIRVITFLEDDLLER
jgi:hypothetical protein